MHILHIMSGFGGGISSFIYNKAIEMSKYNVVFDVITYDNVSENFKSAIEATGGKVYHMLNPKTEGYSSFRKSFQKPFEENEYSIIHSHIHGYRALAYYMLIPSKLRKHFYIHAHQQIVVNTTKDRLFKALDTTLNRCLSRGYIGCGTDAIYSLFGNDIQVDKLMVIPNSININDYAVSQTQNLITRKKFRDIFVIPEDKFIIAQVGRLEKVKNHQFTIELVEYMVQQEIENFEVLFFGNGSLAQSLFDEIQKRGLSDYITLNGRYEPITDVYSGADILILPSFSEGFSTVAVEAQAAGIPIILSTGNTKEVDFNMNLVKHLSLKESHDAWLNAIKEAKQSIDEKKIPKTIDRLEKMEKLYVTNPSSAELYVQYFQGEIKHYVLGGVPS